MLHHKKCYIFLASFDFTVVKKPEIHLHKTKVKSENMYLSLLG